MSRFRAGGAVVIFTAAPLAVLPGGLFPFALPKITLVLVGVLLAATAPASGRLPRMLAWVTVAAVAWLALAAVLHGSPVIDLIGRYPRYEGALAVTAYAGALWSGARLLGGTAPAADAARQVYLRATAVAVLLVTGFACAEATGARPIAGTSDERVGSFLGNATDLGVYAAVVAVLLIPATLRAWNRPRTVDTALFTLAEVAAVLAVALSGSRAALLAVLAGVGVALAGTFWFRRAQFPTARPPRATARPLVLVTLAAAVGAGLLMLLLPSSTARLTGDDAVARASATGRVLIWQRTAELAADHPLVGVGPNGYAHAILARTDAEWARRIGFEHPLDSPHNWALQILVAGGVPLLLIGLAWLVLAARAALTWESRPPAGATPFEARQRLYALSAVVAAAIALLTHVTSPGVVPVVMLLAGWVVAGDASPPRRGDAAVQIGWALAAASLALVAGAGAVAEVPLRQARDAAMRADAATMVRACDRAGAWRPWDQAVPSVCAQNAVVAAQSTQDETGRRGLGDAAAGLASTALRRDPGDLGARYARAVAADLRGDGQAALSDLDAVLDVTPDDPAVLLRRGVVRANLDDLPGAAEDFRAALAVDPDDRDAAKNLEIVEGLLAGE